MARHGQRWWHGVLVTRDTTHSNGNILFTTQAALDDKITEIVNADGSGLSAVPGIETAEAPAWRPEQGSGVPAWRRGRRPR